MFMKTAKQDTGIIKYMHAIFISTLLQSQLVEISVSILCIVTIILVRSYQLA